MMKNLFSYLHKCVFLLILTAVTLPNVFGQTTPVVGLHKNVPRVILFTNARIIVSPGKILDNAQMLIRNDQIESVGIKIDRPADAAAYDLGGKTIYPGFIDLFSNYGLAGKDDKSLNKNSLGATHWHNAIHPEKSAEELFKSDEKMAKILRGGGFTNVLTFPEEGIFRGSGALVQLTDKMPNEILLKTEVAQAMSFSKGKLFKADGIDAYPRSLMGTIALIRQTFLDAQWYEQAWEKYNQAPNGQEIPEIDLGLAALQPFMKGKKPIIMVASDELDILRADKISREFNLDMWILGSGHEYRRIEKMKSKKLNLIIPVSFPDKPDVTSKEKELNISLREMKHWDSAPENPGRLAGSGITFALTSSTLKQKTDFLKEIRTAVNRGLSKDEALKALTMTPAKWLKMSHLLGSIERGKFANFFITDGDIFKNDTKILSTWIAGEKYVVNKQADSEVRGTWSFSLQTNSKTDTGSIVISGEYPKYNAEFKPKNKKLTAKTISLENNIIMLSFDGDAYGYKGLARMTGLIEGDEISGHGIWGDASTYHWSARRKNPWQAPPDTIKTEKIKMAQFPVVYPDGAYGNTTTPAQPGALLIKNATIWTCGPSGKIEGGDLIVENGKIIEIGKNLQVPAKAAVIDATGKHLTPGLIDAHAHIALTGGVNEGSHAITSETRTKDIINPDDIHIYRQLGGGVTTICTLHGSANPIGGTYAVMKMRWGSSPEEMIVKDAIDGIKFALGENVKQSNWNIPTPRYPRTRMGVMEIIEDAFQNAKDYQEEWEIYREKSRSNKSLIAPRKILRYEKILDILEGRTVIHCHGYRQDELLALLRLAKKMDFKISVFIHILEGYKIAEELKNHGAMATTFSDWWAYKIEAYDAIPYNGAIMHNQGVIVSYNSDSSELARRMNTEASKAVKWGNVSPEEALKFITLNAAKQLFIDHRIGSLEEGKDADFVLWNNSPLSTYSVCEQTWIDGRKYFDIEEDKERRKKIAVERNILVQKILSQKDDQKKMKKNKKKKSY
jgi:imidazolonepropionase-like amidohydrolase